VLPVGTYEVIVVAKGFEQYRASGIVLTGGDDRTMNIQLSVGAASESVEVRAEKTEVSEVGAGEKSYTISADDLPQVTLIGRDATEIVTMMPGAVMVANSGVNSKSANAQAAVMNAPSALGNSSVNGQSIDITMDGGHTFDPGAMGAQSPVTSNQDMIAEVKILTSNFTADNAKGPVVVNVVSKNGGAQFHGDAYVYARNHAMNSIDSFEKENGITTKPNESYYYPGGSVGGPVIIPRTGFNRNRNKLFFFDGFEYYKQTSDLGIDSAFVPTQQMLGGDFSAVSGYGSQVIGGSVLSVNPTQPIAANWRAFDPTQSVSATRLAGCTIAGGVLSQACLDPNAVALFSAYMPAPTTPNGVPNASGANYIQDLLQPSNMTQNMARVDYDYSDNSKLFFSYNRQRQTQTWTQGLWLYTAGGEDSVPAPSTTIGGDQSDFISANFMHVFSPSLTSESRFTYTYLNYPETAVDQAKVSRAGIAGLTLKGIYGSTAAPDLVTWGAGFPNAGAVGYQFPVACYKHIPAFGEDVTKVFGKHTAKAGTYFEYVQNAQNNWGQWGGFYSYGNYWASPTGNQYADALMGIGQGQYTEAPQPPAPINSMNKILSFYVQDDWKATRRLTVQYGIRFEHYGKPYSTPYGLAQFNPATYDNDPSVVGENTGATWHAINPKVPLSGTASRPVFYSPRLGAAFDVFGNGRTIARGGWGKYRAYDNLTGSQYAGPALTSYGSVQWQCQENDANCPSWEDVDTHSTGPAVFGKGIPGGWITWPNSISTMAPNDDEQPLVTTFSATIDQKLPGKLSTEVSYVGNISQYMQTQVNINAIPLGALIGTACATELDVACLQTYRPRQNYQDIEDTMTAGKARFDSLQASLQRTSGFLTLMVNYTYSKSLGDAMTLGGNTTSAYKDYGENEFYGVLPGNRPNVLSTIYVVHMPSLRGGNAVVKGVANGWELSGTTQIESGANLTSAAHGLNCGFNPATIPAAYNSTGADFPQTSATLLGTTSLQLQPLLTCDPRRGNPKGYYLNASCFSLPAGNGINGTTKMPYLPGPMYWNSDLTLIKNLKIGESKSAQFRIAGFNFLNHDLLSFAPGDSNLDMNNMAYVPGQGEVNTNPNFGRAMWHIGTRIIELGAKFSF
jgi:hypothetical protein